jgi:hypothetical protein
LSDEMDLSKLGETNPDLLIYFMNTGGGMGFYPLDRPERVVPAGAETHYVVHSSQLKQTIRGIGFEIMSDSIGSGNSGLPEETISVPHDLVAEERIRLCEEMLKGFRYCRLAGGLFWRGLDAERKHLRPRWPEQLSELQEMIATAGVEGVSLEYWSPPPFWKATQAYAGDSEGNNRLRCFVPEFADDPIYRGDIDQFLLDFGHACIEDLRTLRSAGIPVLVWNLQAEPFTNAAYSTCLYSDEDYVRTFKVVAPLVRAFDPNIQIIADTSMSWDFPFIRPLLDDPQYASLVDALVIHLIGYDSKNIRPPQEPSGKPRYNNEFEYLYGPATPGRCLNTVQNIMNWFQLGDAQTWYWLHALKPYTNREASGYSLGYWRPVQDDDASRYPPGLEPGHWVWNRYNWFAVGSFIRHMPWDCLSVPVTEMDVSDDDLRICAFKRPNGKLSIVLSNRCFEPHTFSIDTELESPTFRGYRYTPEAAGHHFEGVPVGEWKGRRIAPELPDMTWEFWEEL